MVNSTWETYYFSEALEIQQVEEQRSRQVIAAVCCSSALFFSSSILINSIYQILIFVREKNSSPSLCSKKNIHVEQYFSHQLYYAPSFNFTKKILY